LVTQSSKTFRVFVSSTFSDLKEERNVLQRDVFPKLCELCMRHGCRFQAVDLRWGVSEEAALDQQTMKICLEEIKRCQNVTPKPNFIVLLGDRYGWRPLPYEIPADEFERILKKVSPEEKDLLSWDASQPGGKKGWYRRDGNAVPQVYRLQPRTGEYEAYANWETVEQRLRRILQRAAEELGLAAKERLKYVASATEQEIVNGALEVPDAKDHVFCFFRKINGLADGKNVKDFIDLKPDGSPDKEARLLLDELKRKKLRKHLPRNIYQYDARWSDGNISEDHLKKLCADVERSLSKVILDEISKLEKINSFEHEIAAHEVFKAEQAKDFIGRESYIDLITAYCNGVDRRPIIVCGDMGSGKTSLIAKAIERMELRDRQVFLIYRFIGATPGSSALCSLLNDVCRQISMMTERKYEMREDFNGSVKAYYALLQNVPGDRKLVIFLDALDQFYDEDIVKILRIVPGELPENVKIVATIQKNGLFGHMQNYIPAENFIELAPMATVEGERLLVLWLDHAGRTLQQAQKTDILSKFAQCGLPLYLRLMFDEARGWTSYEGPPCGARSGEGLSRDVDGIIGDMFDRLEKESNHGRVLTAKSLGYLAAAKNGLTEDELLNVLSADDDVMRDFYRRSPDSRELPGLSALPTIVWSRLRMDIEPYLMERNVDGVMTFGFYHRRIEEVAAGRYLTEDSAAGLYRGLVRYFSKQPLLRDGNWNSVNMRKVSELPYLLIRGKMLKEAFDVLTDIDFIEAKCCTKSIILRDDVAAETLYNGIYDVLDDYDRLRTAVAVSETVNGDRDAVIRILEMLYAILRNHAAHCRVLPMFTSQYIRNFLGRHADNPLLSDLINKADAAMRKRIWLKLASPIKKTLQSNWIFAIPVGHKPLETYFLSSGDIVAITDKSCTILQAETGKIRMEMQEYSILGSIAASALTNNDKHLILLYDNGECCLYSMPDGMMIKHLKAYDEIDSARLAVSGNSEYFTSLVKGKDEFSAKLKIWKLRDFIPLAEKELFGWLPFAKRALQNSFQSAIEMKTYEIEHLSCPVGICFCSDDTKLLISTGCLLLIWDWETDKIIWNHEFSEYPLAVERYRNGPNCMAVTRDCAVFFVEDNDEGQCLWELSDNPQKRMTLDEHQGATYARFNQDASLLAVVQGDTCCIRSTVDGKRIGAFDIPSLMIIGTLSYIHSVCFSPDRKSFLIVDTQKYSLYDLDVLCGASVGKTYSGKEIYVAVYQSDGKHVVIGTYGALDILDLQTGEDLYVRIPANRLKSIDCCPNRNLIAYIPFGSNKCGIVDSTGMEKPEVYVFDKDKPLSVKFSLAGDSLLIGMESGTCYRWNWQKGTMAELRFRFDGPITVLALSPDGGTLAAAGESRKCIVWDILRNKKKGVLAGHTAWITSVAFSRDGSLMATGGIDHVICIWSLGAGCKLLKVINCYNAITSAVFHQSGEFLLSCDAAGICRLWNINTTETVTACFLDSACIACRFFENDTVFVSRSGMITRMSVEGL
jgi:WD40 repeat protein